MIEKNSHFNFLFAFPRFSVIPGHEKKAFIPYKDITRAAPIGSFQRIQGFVNKVDSDAVWLKSGEKIAFSYLVIATGSSQQLPAKAASTDHEGACEELRSIHRQIQDAQRIAVIGAGAVGVEMATDIKSFHSTRDVTIFSSRDKLLPSFGPELHDCASEVMDKMGVVMRYNERATVLPDAKSLQLSNGDVEKFDLVLVCTGQKPNSGILQEYAPEAISKTTHRILVRPTLQLQSPEAYADNVFALGDVAETGGPKMARAGFFQSMIVAENIVSMINGKLPPRTYQPVLMMEGPIKLTLGKGQTCFYIPDPDGDNRIFTVRDKKEDLDVANGWRMLGARLPKDL